MSDELESLRKEVAELRAEVERLRGAIYPQPVPYYVPFVIHGPQDARPLYPGGPYPATCGGEAVSTLMGGTDFSKSSGPNAP